MSDKKNFQVKNGLSINGTQVIDGSTNATFSSIVTSGINLLDYTQAAFNASNGANGLAQGSYNAANTNATNITAVNQYAASAYASGNTNATNITTGTLPYAQLGSAVVNTSGNFTLSGNTTLAGTTTTISSNLNVTGTY